MYQQFLGTGSLSFTSVGCIGAGADGASVNFGQKAGMMKKLQEDIPWLLPVHCVSHRLELAVKDALKATYFDEVHIVLIVSNNNC